MVRLNKVVSQAAGVARRKADELIAAGAIAVNGRTVRLLGTKIDPTSDRVTYRGRVLDLAPRQALLYRLYKPVGVVSTMHDELDRPSLRQFVPEGSALFPVGRLDRQSEGLLLLTNDGELALRLAHPRYRQAKIYRIWIHRPSSYSLPAVEAALKRRYVIAGRHRSFDHVEYKGTDNGSLLFDVTVHEGVFHEVKRVVDRAGYTVSRLVRLQHGPVELGDLKPGELRQLTEDELASVRVRVQQQA